MRARDKQRIADVRTRLRDKKPISDQEFQQIWHQYKGEFREDMRDHPVAAVLAAFSTAATIVAPFALLC